MNNNEFCRNCPKQYSCLGICQELELSLKEEGLGDRDTVTKKGEIITHGAKEEIPFGLWLDKFNFKGFPYGEAETKKLKLTVLQRAVMVLKVTGFEYPQIAKLLNKTEESIRKVVWDVGVKVTKLSDSGGYQEAKLSRES